MENVRHTCAKAGLQADIKKERLKPESLPDCTPVGSKTLPSYLSQKETFIKSLKRCVTEFGTEFAGFRFFSQSQSTFISL